MGLIERFTPGGNMHPDGSSTFAMLVHFFRRQAENRDQMDNALRAEWATDDTAAVGAANSYADQRADVAANTAVAAANTYTDTETSAAEARAVTTAAGYTDEQVGLVQAGVVTDAGVDSGIDRALTDGRIDTSVNDDALAGVVNDPASASRGALDAQYANQHSLPSVLYVDPVNGADTNTGSSWKRAKSTIQAAVDAAAAGAEVVLAPGTHTVGTGVFVEDVSKALTIRGASPLMSRGHADSTFKQTYITSGLTDTARPTSLVRVGTPASPHVYGWTFESLYFNADSILETGECIRTHGVNKAVLRDIATRALTVTGTSRYLVRSDGGAGNDASWWHFENVNTTGVGLAVSVQGNYWTFDSVNVHGGGSPKMAGPALDLQGSQHNLSGLNIEVWVTGIRATGCRGLLGQGVMSESVTQLVHMIGCSDSIISVNSAAGSGQSEVLDENGTRNMVLGADHRKTGSTSGALTISDRGIGPMQLSAGSATLYHAGHPTRPSPGDMMLPQGAIDLVASGVITAEYWNGTSWVSWGTETGYLSAVNSQGVTVDATHKRCRFRSASLTSSGAGMAYTRFSQTQGSTSTCTFRMLSGDGVTVLAQYGVTIDSPAQTRGAMASFPTNLGGQFFEVEFDFGITGTQTVAVRRLHLFASEAHAFTRGKHSTGAKSPVSLIEGTGGDTYLCTGTSATDSNIGLWICASGTNTTSNWKKLAYA